MSQITRCPQCQTRFKVVDDQLRISDGWVRCGKCKSVFDALTHLVQRQGAATASPAEATGASGAVAQPVADAFNSDAQALSASAVSQAHSPVPSQPADSIAAQDAAVLVTGNSMAIDPHANAPELSVLVFPRRGNFGESGYVDSSWMSAYEDGGSAEAAKAMAASSAGAAKAAVIASSVVELAPALESEWNPAGHRPDALRQGAVGFSAQDDLAELQARESRLMEAIAEQKSRTETKVLALEEAGIDPGKAIARPAPAPRMDVPAPTALSQEGSASHIEDKAPTAPESKAKRPDLPSGVERGGEAPPPMAPEVADRPGKSAKVESSLAAAPNFVAEIDASAVPAEPGLAPQQEPGFVRDAKRKAFWNQPKVLVISGLCAALLLAALLIQIAVVQRDRLAVLHPQWRPALEKICQVARCQIALPRQLQSISIDSTTFNPMGPGQFKLTVVLRNAADYAVAMPALELSLNDAAEKLVLRRVLGASDLQAPAQLPAHGEWTGVIALTVADRGQEVVGYRVQAFYP
ncbi:DUF3426 domain-containing protein [Comamonas odontotermitis]|uniref:DUF3426 domain-containing protein n=1 Tax=Comamonas odontotermitis TaxID=379895 RepID=UPI0016130268|nr:DUF3426 domain-containing protein [Comamonas odontotermitis]